MLIFLVMGFSYCMNNKVLLMLTLCLCVGALANNLSVQDTVIWRKTPISHIAGEKEMELELEFYNPCAAIFSNFTYAPGIDDSLVEVCSQAYRHGIYGTLNNLIGKYRVRRDGGASLAIIIGVSALNMSAVQILNGVENSDRDRIHNKLFEQLNDRISVIQDKFIVSNTRISKIINKQQKEIKALGHGLEAQPHIIKALFIVLQKITDERKRIEKLAKQDRGDIPPILLEMFNISEIADSTILRHSIVHSCALSGNTLKIKVTLLTASKNVQILKADPFHYYGIEDDILCTFKYNGPELVLYNESSHCFKELYPEEVDVTFTEKSFYRQAIEKKMMYSSENCRRYNDTHPLIPRVQIKHTGSQLRINCQGHNITLDNVVRTCPNHIIGIEDNTKFQIDNTQTYIVERSSFKKQLINYEIPDKINLHLGTAGMEFESITTEDLQQLHKKAEETGNKIMTNKFTDKPSDNGFFATIFYYIIDKIKAAGDYISVCIAIFLIAVFIKGN